jgi:MoaA/NifB/PqqE/SkfB family radical SAM enzyme
MDHRTEKYLSRCAEMDFGTVALSGDQRRFYRRLNDTNVSLCASLPESIQEEALTFLRRYSGVQDSRNSDFYKHYYAPSWTILYWLVQHDRQNGSRLTGQDISDAVLAHAMAMNLHSMDDHLNDGQMPPNHLTLLLRSQSWMVMNEALCSLDTGVAGGEKIVAGFINDYYSAICHCEKPESLDDYCNGFRKQMATALIVPVLVSRKIGFDDNRVEAVQNAYESFGIAWRLLDDIQDIEKDIRGGEQTAIYADLPETTRQLMDNQVSGDTAESIDDIGQVFAHLIADGVVDRVRERTVRELENAASIVSDIRLNGLADELRCLAEPLKNGWGHSDAGYLNKSGRLDLSNNTLSVEVTTHCNSKCNHCFVRASLTKPSSLPLETVNGIISEGRDLGYRKLHITGGELLLWDGLFEALTLAEEIGFESIFLNTNGTLIDKEIAGRLGSYRGLKISVSLEGRESLHDAIRGAGSYEQATAGIENALNAGVPLSIFTTLRKRLLPYISYFIDEVYEEFPAIDHLTLIQLIRVKDDVFDLSDDLLTPDEFNDVVQAASLLNLFGRKTAVLNNPLANAASGKMGIWGIPFSSTLHSGGDLIIMADLSIACAHSSNAHLGTYHPGAIADVLASSAYRFAVAPDTDTCPACPHYDLCRGNGMMHPSEPYRDMRTDEPFCRRVLDNVPFTISQSA